MKLLGIPLLAASEPDTYFAGHQLGADFSDGLLGIGFEITNAQWQNAKVTIVTKLAGATVTMITKAQNIAVQSQNFSSRYIVSI